MNATRTLAATAAALLLALPALAQTAAPAPTTPPAAPAPAPATAPAPAKTPNPNNGHGKITAVSAASLTVQPKNGEAKTFAITPKTKVTLDGQPSTVAALLVGERANVASRDGATARAIKAHTKKAKTATAAPRFHGFKAPATL